MRRGGSGDSEGSVRGLCAARAARAACAACAALGVYAALGACATRAPRGDDAFARYAIDYPASAPAVQATDVFGAPWTLGRTAVYRRTGARGPVFETLTILAIDTCGTWVRATSLERDTRATWLVCLRAPAPHEPVADALALVRDVRFRRDAQPFVRIDVEADRPRLRAELGELLARLVPAVSGSPEPPTPAPATPTPAPPTPAPPTPAPRTPAATPASAATSAAATLVAVSDRPPASVVAAYVDRVATAERPRPARLSVGLGAGLGAFLGGGTTEHASTIPLHLHARVRLEPSLALISAIEQFGVDYVPDPTIAQEVRLFTLGLRWSPRATPAREAGVYLQGTLGAGTLSRAWDDSTLMDASGLAATASIGWTSTTQRGWAFGGELRETAVRFGADIGMRHQLEGLLFLELGIR